jgi:hypothetical protein
MIQVSEIDLQGKDANWWAKKIFPWPECRERTQMFINGDFHVKETMFIWIETPQGYNYWRDLREDSPYLEEAISFCRWLVRGTIRDEETETL